MYQDRHLETQIYSVLAELTGHFYFRRQYRSRWAHQKLLNSTQKRGDTWHALFGEKLAVQPDQFGDARCKIICRSSQANQVRGYGFKPIRLEYTWRCTRCGSQQDGALCCPPRDTRNHHTKKMEPPDYGIYDVQKPRLFKATHAFKAAGESSAFSLSSRLSFSGIGMAEREFRTQIRVQQPFPCWTK